MVSALLGEEKGCRLTTQCTWCVDARVATYRPSGSWVNLMPVSGLSLTFMNSSLEMGNIAPANKKALVSS